MMDFRIRMQLAEALGKLNRWYCSQAHGRRIDDPELLLAYYIRSGGAEDFAFRYGDAMGKDNRWFCSEFHRRDIRDAETLWNYYMDHLPSGSGGNVSRNETDDAEAELSVAC